jgi:hypothetical protein
MVDRVIDWIASKGIVGKISKVLNIVMPNKNAKNIEESTNIRNTENSINNTNIRNIENSINNNLIIARPQEVQLAIKQQARTKREDLDAELESEAQRRISQTIKKTNEELETARIIALAEYIGKAGCNPSTSVCVVWERNDVPDIQSKGKGVAFRSNEDHYAEVKTSGYSSNTFVSITHNDQYADTVIGDGSPSGNIVKIIQNTGVLRRP